LKKLLETKVVQNEKELLEIRKVAKKAKKNVEHLVESPIYIISINKTIAKESKQTKTKTFVFVVALKRAVLKFSENFCTRKN